MKGSSRPGGARCCSHCPPLTFPSANNTSHLLIDFLHRKQTLTNERLSPFTPNTHTCTIQRLIFFFTSPKKEQSEGGALTGGSVHYGVLQVEQSTKSPISTTQNKNKYVLHGVLIGTFSSLLYLTIIRIWALKNKREII